MGLEPCKDSEERRSRTRTAIVLLLLITLCMLAVSPFTDSDLKQLVIGGLINSLGMAIVFYFKKSED